VGGKDWDLNNIFFIFFATSRSDLHLIIKSSGQVTRTLRSEGFNALHMVGGMLVWNKILENMTKDTSGVKHETIVE
jgi:hypothetical protein